MQIFDDYGHHPVEIKAVLKAAREACKGRIIAVHQPHRYTRLASLFEEFAACFNDADSILLAPVYAAGEDAIEGIDSISLVSRIKSGGHRDARFLASAELLPQMVAEVAKQGISWFCWGLGASHHGQQHCPSNWKAYRESPHETGEWGKASRVSRRRCKGYPRPYHAGCPHGPCHLVQGRRPGRTDVPAA